MAAVSGTVSWPTVWRREVVLCLLEAVLEALVIAILVLAVAVRLLVCLRP
jgi:hypothetical protein